MGYTQIFIEIIRETFSFSLLLYEDYCTLLGGLQKNYWLIQDAFNCNHVKVLDR